MGKQYLNGVLYGTGEVIKFSPYIYSLAEREVGVCIDGKPLYVKTWTFTNSTSTFNDFITIPNGTIANLDKIVNLQTVAKRTFDDVVIYLVGGSVISLEKSQTSNYRVLARIKNGEVQYLIEQYGTQITDMTMTVWYTKTTDTPGSGHYTQNGGQAVHYDGTEQIIGTWFGETLYQKTVDCGGLLSAQTKSVAHGISNLKFVTSFTGACSGYTPTAYYPLPLVQGSSSLTNYQVKIEADATYIKLTCGADLTPITSSFVTIQYTKTTD